MRESESTSPKCTPLQGEFYRFDVSKSWSLAAQKFFAVACATIAIKI
jgi:hypothetical protein